MFEIVGAGTALSWDRGRIDYLENPPGSCLLGVAFVGFARQTRVESD